MPSGRPGCFIGTWNAYPSHLLLSEQKTASSNFGWPATHHKPIFILHWEIYKTEKNAFIDLKRTAANGIDFRQSLEQCGLTDKTYYMGNIENNKQIDITYKNLGEASRRKIDFTPITFIQIITTAIPSSMAHPGKVISKKDLGAYMNNYQIMIDRITELTCKHSAQRKHMILIGENAY